MNENLIDTPPNPSQEGSVGIHFFDFSTNKYIVNTI